MIIDIDYIRFVSFCSLCLKAFLIAKLGRASCVFVFLKCFESGQAGRWHFEQNPAEVLHLHSRSLHCNGFQNYIQFLWRECMPFKKRDLSVRPFQTTAKDDVLPRFQATRALETRTFKIAIL